MPDLNALLRPRSVALIGASPDPHIIRGRIVRGVQHLPYPGKVYAVSRSHDDVAGLPTVRDVAELPPGIDLAVITVPARYVAASLDACGKQGMRAAVIISSGFAEERGEAGAARQRELAEVARRHDMAVCGPNGEGFLASALPLAATFSPAVFEWPAGRLMPATDAGAVAVVSQSGGIGFSFLDRGVPMQVPFSHVVCTGNEATLDGLTLVEHLLDDDATGCVLMFLEGLRDAARLDAVMQRAHELGKTVVVAKMGRSEAGAQAAASHTASMAGSYRAYAAKLRACGALLADDQDHALGLIHAASYLGRRLPAGKRVGVLTPSGGAGIWMADVCAAQGLQVPPLDPATRATFDELLPEYGASRNPVDVTAQFIFQHGYARALEIMAESPCVDSMVVASSLIHAETIEMDMDNLRRVGRRLRKPAVFCAYTRANAHAVALLAEAGIPCFTSAVNAARALHDLAEHAAFRARRGRQRPTPATVAPAPCAPPSAGPVLSEYQTRCWLAASGVPMPPATLATSAAEAVSAAARLGLPVALKIQSPELPHKTEVDGVALGLADAAQVEAAATRLLEAARQRVGDGAVEGVLVQPMAAAGVELIAGVHRDPDFGPMLLLGSGGILVELLDDSTLLPLPASREELAEGLRRLRCWKLLQGFRGQPAADVEALLDLLEQIAAFALAQRDRLAELDINPLRVHPAGGGVTALDALARLQGPSE